MFGNYNLNEHSFNRQEFSTDKGIHVNTRNEDNHGPNKSFGLTDVRSGSKGLNVPQINEVGTGFQPADDDDIHRGIHRYKG